MHVEPARREEREQQRVSAEEAGNRAQLFGQPHLEGKVAEQHVPVALAEIGGWVLHQCGEMPRGVVIVEREAVTPQGLVDFFERPAPPTARYVLPHCSLARVPLHQDVSYNRHMEDFCVVWVPLVPIDQACGGMAAYARTHKTHEMVLEHRRNAADGWLPPIDEAAVDPAKRVVLAPLEVGDLVVMTKSTLHESMPNLSNRMRLSCDFRFFGERSHSTKHYLDIAADKVVAPPVSAGK